MPACVGVEVSLSGGCTLQITNLYKSLCFLKIVGLNYVNRYVCGFVMWLNYFIVPYVLYNDRAEPSATVGNYVSTHKIY